MKLYSAPGTCATAMHIALEWIGNPFEVEHLDFAGMKSPEYLKRNGLLRYHIPLKHYAERGLLVDGRYPHKSARMLDDQGVSWAVDSWKGPNGTRPEIITLAKWYKGRNTAQQY